ncbi:MAG: hypothetical protein KAJ42_12625 [Gemmatimonadetes bacterium]|nr:hypothetical protein [Gemmatimonadota bacterium]
MASDNGQTIIKKKTVVKDGLSFGSALAIAVSYTTHQSILWAILHGIFGWFYVVYFVLTR